jgi:hypothetical protein
VTRLDCGLAGLLLVASAGVARAQQGEAVSRSQGLLRFGAGIVTANGLGALRPVVELAGGVLLAGRYAIVGQYLQHSAYRVPARAELGVFTRRFLLASVEWSRWPLTMDNLGDVHGALRGTVGAVFREQLGAGAVIGVGGGGRFGLNRYLSVMLDVQGLLSVLPHDDAERCTTDGSIDLNCNPLAGSGSVRPEGWVALLLEVRP